MDVASLELCKELYELSGWLGNSLVWDTKGQGSKEHHVIKDVSGLDEFVYSAPAYNLGYLLRKLPRRIEYPKKGDTCEIYVGGWANDPDKWWAGYRFWDPQFPSLGFKADTPEDAICFLAIKLIKQGIIKPEEADNGKVYTNKHRN